MQQNIDDLAYRLGALALSKDVMICTAESCTAGGIAYSITEIAGSSAWFDRAFVTYTNASKEEMLDVSVQTLQKHGAVSQEVTAQMTAGALAHSHADWAVAVSGIAGPSGAVPGKPVGTVAFSWQQKNHPAQTDVQYFHGDRQQVRLQTIAYALSRLIKFIEG